MYKKVITYPSRSLYKKCKNVDVNSDTAVRMLDDLLDTFRVIQGYGLAAPQIGHSIRAFVINPIALEIEGSSEEVIEVINPRIECSGQEFDSMESCFSIPEVSCRVKRYENCLLTFDDRSGEKHTIAAVGLPAACIQHEFDHLDGKLFLNRVSSLKRSMLTRKISKIRKKRQRALDSARQQFEEDSRLYDESETVIQKPPPKKRKKRVKRKKQKRK